MADRSVVQSGHYKAYPEYKDSGVEWLGDIPSGWGVVRVKNQFKVYNGATPRSGVEEYWGGDIVWVTPSDLSQLSSNTISESSRTITKQGLSSCGTTLVPKDSLILSCRAPIGSLAITKTELCTNQGCKALVPISDIPVELYYYYFSSINAELNVLGSGSTFLELSTDELVNIALPLPTYSESKLICSFLDYETAKIDTLIEKQQRLIELLVEKRQAVISHAVTKGLNPDVPMKDSGVEWLGEVPEHWDVIKLKRLVEFSQGVQVDLGLQKHNRFNGSLKFLRIENYTQRSSDFRFIYPQMAQGKLVNKDDVVMVRYGASAGYIGRGLEGVLANNLFKITPFDQLITHDFLNYFLNNSYRYLQKEMSGSAMPAISFSMVGDIFVALPSLNEQIEIVKWVELQLAKLNSLEDKAEQAIQLMQERRTALISAAVTGKIDVRDWDVHVASEVYS